MATTYTPNAKLQKPAANDRSWDGPVNANADTLDGMNAIGALCVTLAETPSASLNVSVAAGPYTKADGTTGTYAGTATQAMTASATSNVYLTDAGVLTISTVSFPTTGNYLPLAVVVAGASTITSVTDARRYQRSRGGHVHIGIGTPTIAAGAGAGTSPTATIAGSDQAGLIAVTTGTTPTASAVVATATFGQAWSAAARTVLLIPANAATAALSGTGAVYVDSAGVTTTQFTLSVGSSALAASTAYKWWYQVMG